MAANVIDGLSLSEARQIANDVFGESKDERVETIRNAVYKLQVAGSNVVEGGVSHSRLEKGGIHSAPANFLTAVEEIVEGRWKAGAESGRYKKSQMLQWVRMAEDATGEKYLTAMTDEEVLTHPELSPRALTEAISRIVVADALGRRLDGSRMQAGLITDALAKSQHPERGMLAAVLRAFRELLRQVFHTARKLKKARKEGKLGDDWETILDDLLGTAQTVHEREAEKEAYAIANEALYAGGASYSEANPGPNGETFSVRKGSRNPQSWDGVGEGTPWAKALKFLPRTNEARRGFFKRGSWDALVKRVAGWLTQMGTVKDPWGAAVKFDNPQKMGEFSDTLENRAAHLLGEQRDKRIERRTLDPDKRDWIGSTLETIRDAQVRVKAHSGETLYFRSYKEGVHMVVVESGKVKDQYGLLTQYAPELTKGKFEGDVVERVRLPGLAPQGGAGSVSLPTQPQNQTAQTPTPGAQGKDAATGGQSQETHSLRNFDSASRAVPADASKQTIMPDGARLVGPTTFSIRAYHGTPHEVDKFRLDKIGTGEGAQAYGWGLYFAESVMVAEGYSRSVRGKVDSAEALAGQALFQDRGIVKNAIESLRAGDVLGFREEWRESAILALKEGRASQGGNLYTVELLPDADEFLDWDKPLRKQSEKVEYALLNAEHNQEANRIFVTYFGGTGREIYESIVNAYREEDGIDAQSASRKASELLNEFGIPGCRYLDGGSRGGSGGTYNYVIFDENLVRILEKNGRPVETFSIRSGDFSSRMTAAFAPFQRSPELRLAIAQVAKDRAMRLGAEWIDKAAVLRSARDISREQRFREADGYERRIQAYLDSLSPAARQELEFEPSALEDDPLIIMMLDFGHLMSYSTTKKAGLTRPSHKA